MENTEDELRNSVSRKNYDDWKKDYPDYKVVTRSSDLFWKIAAVGFFLLFGGTLYLVYSGELRLIESNFNSTTNNQYQNNYTNNNPVNVTIPFENRNDYQNNNLNNYTIYNNITIINSQCNCS